MAVLALAALTVAVGPPVRADGDAPFLLADLHDGLPPGSEPAHFLAVGAHTFFVARTSGTGRELWRTDGTATGTRLVYDVRSGVLGSAPEDLVAFGDLLLFTADDGETGRELWRSDGTPAGTWRVADIRSGSAGSFPTSPAVMDGAVYFSAAEDGLDRELWRSDGTAEGTWRVRDIAPGPGAGSDPFWLCAVDGLLVFAATDGAGERELWVSDGTEAGTQPVAVRPGPLSSAPSNVTRAGPYAVFQAAVDGGRHVWRIDPATRVVELLADALTVDSGQPIVASGGRVFVYSYEGLWTTDGIDFEFVHPFVMEPFDSGAAPLVAGGWLLAAADGSEGNVELWRTDGTAAGTAPVAELHPGPLGSVPYGFRGLGNDALFFADTGADTTGLFRSDGTPAGTTLVDALPIAADPRGLTPAAFSIVFAANADDTGRELWRTQGVPGTTVLLRDIDVATGDADPAAFLLAGGRAFFLARDGDETARRWRSDGTNAGTVLLEGGPWPWFGAGTRMSTLGPAVVVFDGNRVWRMAPGGAVPELLAEVDGGVVQQARDPVASDPLLTMLYRTAPRPATVEWRGSLWFLTHGTAGDALWRSDGTSSGTQPVYQTTAWGWSLDEPRSTLRVAGDRLFFLGRDGELWTSDGTTDGTRQVRDINPGAPPSEPRHPTVVGARVFFSANDPDEGRELWVSDGREEGTTRVAAIRPGPLGAEPGPLAALGARLLFGADDGHAGRELWMSDGTEEGTILLDLALGARGSDPREFVRVGDRVFFSAADGIHGRELWTSDGTAEGTELLLDIVPGPVGSHAREFAVWGDRLVFDACDAEAGCEPWTSDGTKEGTQRLADLVPGPLGSDPGAFTSDGVRLVFAASSEQAGREVWWVPEPGAGAAGAAALAALAALAQRRVVRWAARKVPREV
jgi:ELWxxDGT repeat protein